MKRTITFEVDQGKLLQYLNAGSYARVEFLARDVLSILSHNTGITPRIVSEAGIIVKGIKEDV